MLPSVNIIVSSSVILQLIAISQNMGVCYKMGDRYELILSCVYCDSRNDVWYAPTCSSDTFSGFKSKKVEDVEYIEVERGFLNATNVSWTVEQVEKICKERHNSIKNANLSK